MQSTRHTESSECWWLVLTVMYSNSERNYGEKLNTVIHEKTIKQKIEFKFKYGQRESEFRDYLVLRMLCLFWFGLLSFFFKWMVLNQGHIAESPRRLLKICIFTPRDWRLLAVKHAIWKTTTKNLVILWVRISTVHKILDYILTIYETMNVQMPASLMGKTGKIIQDGFFPIVFTIITQTSTQRSGVRGLMHPRKLYCLLAKSAA